MLGKERKHSFSDLKSVEYPGTKFHDTYLIIEWKISDIDRTCASELGRGRPKHISRGFDHCTTVHISSRVIIGAKKRTCEGSNMCLQCFCNMREHDDKKSKHEKCFRASFCG